MAVALDIIDSTISKDENGYRIERTAIITGATGTAAARLYNALQDASLPDIGDTHPDIAGITLRDISATPIDPETMKVTLSYYNEEGQAVGSSNATVQSNASTSLEETKVDKAGATMETVYITNEDLLWSWSTVKPTFTAEVERPRITYDFEYTTSTFPKTEIDTYLGKINSVIWNGYAVRTILCAAVNVSQQGSDFQVRMSFVYNADTWDFFGKVPDAPANIASSTDTDLDQTTGIKTFDVYDTVSFATLGFTI